MNKHPTFFHSLLGNPLFAQLTPVDDPGGRAWSKLPLLDEGTLDPEVVKCSEKLIIRVFKPFF
jgi:hypothetical protein